MSRIYRHHSTSYALVGAGLALALNLAAAAPLANAQETCWTVRRGQFFNAMHYCVSSVLAPQGGNSYGPENLMRWDGNAGKAWCEGAPGNGIGETITIAIEGAAPFRRLLVGNGYPKSAKSYAENGRVKTMEIIGDNGIKARVGLADRSDLVPVNLPHMTQHWIQLKIVEVYPGARFADTCLSFVMPDHEYEEELLLKQQGLLPK